MKIIKIKKYNDFNKVVNILNKDKEVKVDFSEIEIKGKIRVLDLLVGYLYDKGTIIKEKNNLYQLNI